VFVGWAVSRVLLGLGVLIARLPGIWF